MFPLNKIIIKNTLLFLLLVELFSIFAYLLPAFNSWAFIIISLLTLFLALEKLEYGLLIAAAELFIGSKGYLFYLEAGGADISIRLALWLIIMSVWLAKSFVEFLKTGRIEIAFLKNSFFYYFLTLFAFIAYGTARGLFLNNAKESLFFDLNGWLYLLLVFPFYQAVSADKGILDKIFSVFLSAASWLMIKTFLLLYFFSHNLSFIYPLYRWVRETGVGEITFIQGGFYRVFFQSHVFILLAFFSAGFFFLKNLGQETFTKTRALAVFAFLTAASSVIITGFSRSFWVGAIFGLLSMIGLAVYEKINWKNISRGIAAIALSAFLGIILITAVVKFPWPDPAGGFNAADLLSKRITENEAAVSSRWALLGPLMDKIKSAPVFGSGFGAAVTYKTSDPRIVETTANALYTTYAFEWGWLDIWLKLGLLGALFYLFFLVRLFSNAAQMKTPLGASLAIGLIIFASVNFFSPYLNHPLAFIFLIISASFLEKKEGSV